MTLEIAILTAAMTATVLGGLFIGAAMHRPLTLILNMLCHGKEAAQFWVVFCKIVFVLAPMFTVSLFLPKAGETITEALPVIFSSAAGGLLLPVLVMGWAVWANRGLAEPADPNQPTDAVDVAVTPDLEIPS